MKKMIFISLACSSMMGCQTIMYGQCDGYDEYRQAQSDLYDSRKKAKNLKWTLKAPPSELVSITEGNKTTTKVINHYDEEYKKQSKKIEAEIEENIATMDAFEKKCNLFNR